MVKKELEKLKDLLNQEEIKRIDTILKEDELETLYDVIQAELDERSKEPQLVQDIVPIDVWLKSSYYNPVADNLYPFWVDEIIDFFEGKYTEWIITGSLGIGKSTAALLVILRKLYELSCWDYPQRLFRLTDISAIYMAYLSVSKEQAKKTGYADLMQMVDATPYFREHFDRDRRYKTLLKYPKNVIITVGSQSSAVISTNLYGVFLDEVNFFKKSGVGSVGDLETIQKIYTDITNRRKSRFVYRGVDYGFSIVVSSSTVQTSFTNERIKKATDKTKITSAALWEAKPPGTYIKPKFMVFVGSSTQDAYIIERARDIISTVEDEEDKKQLQHAFVHSEKRGKDLLNHLYSLLPEHVKGQIIHVPGDFRESFEADIYSALRDIAGLSVAPAGKLFSSRELIYSCVVDLPHPFKKDVITLSTADDIEMLDYFHPHLLFDLTKKSMLRHPGSQRFIHIDQSKTTDKTGIACVHVAEIVEDGALGMVQPVIEVDFVIAISPPKSPARIPFYKIRRFLLQLRDMGMPIGKVTFDQYQSEDHIQLLSRANIPADYVSVDRTDKAYLGLRVLFREKRIRVYNHPVLLKELSLLDHDRVRNKVDHPVLNPDGTRGSKDVSDALCAACYICLQESKNLVVADVTSLIDSIVIPGEDKETFKTKRMFVEKEYSIEDDELRLERLKGMTGDELMLEIMKGIGEDDEF